MVRRPRQRKEYRVQKRGGRVTEGSEHTASLITRGASELLKWTPQRRGMNPISRITFIKGACFTGTMDAPTKTEAKGILATTIALFTQTKHTLGGLHASWTNPLRVVALLALIPAVAGFLGSLLFRNTARGMIPAGLALPTPGIGTFVLSAILSYVLAIVMYFIARLVLEKLAPRYEADPKPSALVTAAAMAPGLLGGVFMLFTPLAILTALAGLFGLYVLYLAQGQLMKVPQKSHTMFFVVTLLVLIIIGVVLGWLMSLVTGGYGMRGF